MATAGGLFGHVGAFNPERERFKSYVERMEMFFTANNIVETPGEDQEAANRQVQERKRAIFLTELGPEVYTTLSNLLVPAKPKDTPLTDMVQALEKHFNPPPLEIAESFHFGTRNQKPGESIGDFIVALKNLTIHCNFGEFLNRALRDRFVCGLNNVKIQNKLLNTENLTFEKACQIAKSMEMAEKNTQEFHPQSRSSGLNEGTVNTLGTTRNEVQECYRCGGTHPAKTCRFKTAKCYKCSKVGHIASVCRNSTSKDRGKEDKSGSKPGRSERGNIQNLSAVDNTNDNGDSDEIGIFSLHSGKSRKSCDRYNVELFINGLACDMVIDTAADFSIMSKSIYDQKFSKFPLYPSVVKLRTYTGETLQVSGEMKCEVVYQGQTYMLTIVVASYEGRPTLLGRDWLACIKLDWGKIFSVESLEQNCAEDQLNKLLLKYGNLFEESYEGMKGFQAHITMKDDAKPVFVKPRKVPYAMKEVVENELEKLEKHGVIKKTDRARWASPVVVVPKADKSVRLCGDYKVTINQSVQDEQYPLPTTQDLYTVLAGSKVFSKLDLSHAYAQLSVDEESQEYLTINTHKGLYSYTKLPYGVKSAPKIFQSKMDQVLQGIDKCVCKQDDILMGGNDWKENLKIVAEVLERLYQHNIHLKQSKCEFLQPEVVYLGLKINAQGLHPVDEKVNAVRKAPVPSNVSELRSFLGMIQYYHSFLPDLATILAPLHKLLKKNIPWEWTKDCQKAYDACKQGLTSDTLLVHYDLNRNLRLACDASSYGLGAVLSHVMDDGQERPIAYASRTLSSSEKNYAQIEREALSIIFGVKKFHQFLYGRKFTLTTDHKPLLAILGPKSAIPTLAAARMQRWAIVLSAYDYEIEYRASEKHANCDALSRLPFENSTIGSESHIYQVSAIEDDFPITAKQIGKATKVDPVLSKVHHFIVSGWPEPCPDESLRPFHNRKLELSCEQGCVLWGSRVVIPLVLREKMLKELHWEHPGVCGMKALARNYVWWPKMDENIEQAVSVCTVCQSVRNTPPHAPLIPWKWPTRPFQRVHIDFCQEGVDHFLVLVDSHSKWIEVRHMTSTTALRTIDELRSIFAAHGLPEEVVSDNGPQFTATEFVQFMTRNGIKHTLVPPYHPQSNGAAERSVRVVKESLVKQVIQGTQGMSIKHRLADFLLRYRTTPHNTTGVSPAELMMKRRLRTRLSLVNPDLAQVIENRQEKQKEYKDKTGKRETTFERNELVRVRNMRTNVKSRKWMLGTVVKVCGPRTYEVKCGERVRRVHIDHLVKARESIESQTKEFEDCNEGLDSNLPEPEEGNCESEDKEIGSSVGEMCESQNVDQNVMSGLPLPVEGVPEEPLRRSVRCRKPVNRFGW